MYIHVQCICICIVLIQCTVLVDFMRLCVIPSDESAVKRLNDLRLTSDDFSVKAVIGRGHFGEVSHNPLLVIYFANYIHDTCI